MLIHELDDAFDFSEVHGGWPSRLDWLVRVRSVNGRPGSES